MLHIAISSAVHLTTVNNEQYQRVGLGARQSGFVQGQEEDMDICRAPMRHPR